MTTTANTTATRTSAATRTAPAGHAPGDQVGSSTVAPVRRRRGVNVALWVLQYALAALYVFAAIPKLTGDPRTAAGFAAIGWGDWFRYLIGTLELAGAVALLIPLLCGLASTAFVGLMIGATVTQIVVFDGEMAAFPAIVGVVVAVVAWTRRDRTAHLVRTLRSRTRTA